MNDAIDKCLSLFSPHICKACGAAGDSLCKRCIFNISRKKIRVCALCDNHISDEAFAKRGNLCLTCAQKHVFDHAYLAGFREKSVAKLLDDYKFNSEFGAAASFAKLLLAILPTNLPRDLTIIPIPTVAKNVRARGFDHMKLVAKKLARLRNLPMNSHLLIRTNNLTQHFLANAAERRANAAQAFAINFYREIPPKILLIDDIITTGSTLTAAAKLLRDAGAREIWLCVAARQPRKKPAKK